MAKKDFPFAVNTENPIAVYVQIENLAKFAIASGRFQPGDTLPSVREMSEGLNINPNTVTKAYRDLELLGLVRPRRGVGVMVTEAAPGLCAKEAGHMVSQRVRDAVGECLAAGLSDKEIRRMVSDALAAKVLPYQA